MVTLGENKTPTYSFIATEISIDNVKKNIKLFIVNECSHNIDVLIGQNFSELLDVDYDKHNGNFKFINKA